MSSDAAASHLASNSELELTTAQVEAAQVVGRHIFYNNSDFDGDDATANESDDDAIAPGPADASEARLGKTALLLGQTASFQNYTSYSRGINGIMVDALNLAQPSAINDADFEFRVGNDDQPENWEQAPDPLDITVRAGAGIDGADRVTIIWTDNAIAKRWLQVTVLGTTNTGLTKPDVHYWGNATVNTTDELGARFNPHNILQRADIDDSFDYNRDEFVGTPDELTARFNATNLLNALRLIRVPEHDPPIIEASLANDTGIQDDDGLTSDQSIAGTLIDQSAITLLRLTIPSLGAAPFDITDRLETDGSFNVDRLAIEGFAGNPLPDGVHRFELTAQDEFGNVSDVASIGFTLDATAPLVNESVLARDTGINRDNLITSNRTPVLLLSLSEPIFGDPADIQVLGPQSESVIADSVDGFGTDTLVLRFDTTLPGDGQYEITFDSSQTTQDAAGNVLTPDQAVRFTIDTQAPSAAQTPSGTVRKTFSSFPMVLSSTP